MIWSSALAEDVLRISRDAEAWNWQHLRVLMAPAECAAESRSYYASTCPDIRE